MMEGHTASFRLSIGQFYRCGMTKVVDHTNVSFLSLKQNEGEKNEIIEHFSNRFGWNLRATEFTTIGLWLKTNLTKRNPFWSSAAGCHIIRNGLPAAANGKLMNSLQTLSRKRKPTVVFEN